MVFKLGYVYHWGSPKPLQQEHCAWMVLRESIVSAQLSSPTADLLNTPFGGAIMRVPFPMPPSPPLQEKVMPLTHPKPYI